MPSFGEKLKRLRKEKQLKQSDLVGPNVSRTVVSLLESGRKTPSYAALKHIASRLDVSVEVFFDGATPAVQQALIRLARQAESAESRESWDEAVQLWDTVLALCDTYDLKSWGFYGKVHSGIALERLELWQRCIDCLLPLLIHPSFHETADTSYAILRGLGNSSRALGKLSDAIIFFRLALHTVSPSDDKWIRTQINLATLYELRGDDTLAEEAYRHATSSAKEVGEGALEAWGLIGWTTVRLNKHTTDQCEDALERAEHFGGIAGMDDIVYAARHNRLVLARIREDFEFFDHHYLTLLNASPNPEWKAQLLHEKILLETARNNWEEVEVAIETGLSLSEVYGVVRGRFLEAAGRSYIEQGRPQVARPMFLQALEIYRTVSNQEFVNLLEYIVQMTRNDS